MKPIPTDPMALHHRWFDALLEDFREAGTITRTTPRADAVVEIARQQRNENGETE